MYFLAEAPEGEWRRGTVQKRDNWLYSCILLVPKQLFCSGRGVLENYLLKSSKLSNEILTLCEVLRNTSSKEATFWRKSMRNGPSYAKITGKFKSGKLSLFSDYTLDFSVSVFSRSRITVRHFFPYLLKFWFESSYNPAQIEVVNLRLSKLEPWIQFCYSVLLRNLA